MKLLKTHQFAALSLARTLEIENKRDWAKQVLDEIWSRSNWPHGLPNLNLFKFDLEILQRVLGITAVELGSRLLDNSSSLTAAALRTSSTELASLLVRLKDNCRKLFDYLVIELASEAAVTEIVSQSTGTKLSSMLDLLRTAAADKDMALFHRALRNKAFPDDFSAEMATRLTEANLNSIVMMLEYLQTESPSLACTVEEFYCTPTQLQGLAIDSVAHDLGVVMRVLKFRRIGPRLSALIDRKSWEERRLSVPARTGAEFLGFSRALQERKYGEDLIIAPARGVIRAASRKTWKYSALSVSLVTEILLYSRGEEHRYLSVFLEMWAEGKTDLGARSLFQVCEAMLIAGGANGAEHEKALKSSTILLTMVVDVLHQEADDPYEAAAVLALTGLAVRLGVRPENLLETRIEEDLLSLVFEFEVHLDFGTDPQLDLALFWLGMRQAEPRGQLLSQVSETEFERSRTILASEPIEAGTIEAARGELLDWLGQCRVARRAR